MNFKNEVINYLSDKGNCRYSMPIIRNLTQQHLHDPEIQALKTDSDNALHICKLLVDRSLASKRYDASLVPTIISPQMAKNFYLKGEKTPSEDELYEFLYSILTGVYKGQYVVNLTNAPQKIMTDFRDSIINENKIIFDSKKDREALGIRLNTFSSLFLYPRFKPPITELTFPFLVLSYFLCWLKERSRSRPELLAHLKEVGLEGIIETELGIRDDTTLVIYVLSRDKKKCYLISRLKGFILKWYKNYLDGLEEFPYIVNTLFSMYITDKNYRDLSSDLLDKFLYYFMEGYVNGELLDKMTILKLEYELKKKNEKIYSISYAKEFFEKLSK